MNNRLYVENLPPGITEGSLRELFSQVGQIAEIDLVMDPATRLPRGKAFVTMASPALAESAIKTLHSHSMGGRNIVVSVARPKEANASGQIGHGFEPGIGNIPQAMGRDKSNNRPRGRRKRR